LVRFASQLSISRIEVELGVASIDVGQTPLDRTYSTQGELDGVL
jgi:hypothetical protein